LLNEARVRTTALCLLLLACSSKVTSDAPASSSSETPPTETVSGAAACAPISGDKPFGVRLSGSGPAADYGGKAAGTAFATVDLYFPRGRVPGGEVVLAIGTYGGGWKAARGTLDGTLSARGLEVRDPHCGDGITGDLVGPTGGIAAIATNNRSAPSDALDLVKGSVVMCAAGAVPEQKFMSMPAATILPHQTIELRAARPLMGTASATPSTDIVVEDIVGGVAIHRKMGWYSLSTPTTIDLSGLRDVLGAPLGLTSARTIVPTAVATDLTFATPYPEGAALGSATVVSGMLVTGGDSEWSYLLAIGDGGGKKKLRMKHRLVCGTSSTGYASVAIVSSDGVATPVVAKCSGELLEDVVEVNGAPPYYLSAAQRTYRTPPCNYGSFGPAPGVGYEVDELAFE
jgi:hypothetical protein